MVNDEKLKKLLEYLSTRSIRDYMLTMTEELNGKYYCVFHDETLPSMYVNEEAGVFKCFSCGRAGGMAKLIYFLKNFEDESVTYYQALEQFLRENPEVCADLGFQSLQDDFFREQKLDKKRILETVKNINTNRTVSVMYDLKINPVSESIDDIIKRMYLRQKAVTIKD